MMKPSARATAPLTVSAALSSYQAARAIAERLAKADPGNAGWQRDLSVSDNKVGNVQLAQGDLSAALTSYQTARAIAETNMKQVRQIIGFLQD